MKLPGDKQTQSATVVVNDQGGPDILAGQIHVEPADPEQARQLAQLQKPFDLTTAQNKLAEFETKVLELKTFADNFQIIDETSFARLAEMTGQAKVLEKSVSRSAEAYYIDHFNFYKSVLNIKNAICNITGAIVFSLKQKADRYAYQKEIDRRADEAKAKAEAASFQKKLNADAKKKNVAPVQMQTVPVIKPDVAPVKTQSGTMSTKMVWDFELTDFRTKAIFDYVLKVCAKEYIAVANKAIKKMVKAGIHEGIKGVKFFERADTTHRAR